MQPLTGPLRGIALKVLSVLIFTVMAAVVKSTSQDIPAGQAVFFRSFFAIPVILVWLVWRQELTTGLRAKKPLGHFWRGVVGTTAMGLGFAGLAYLPFSEVMVIGYTAPLLTVIFAAMFLGEDVRFFRISCVFLGMLGVVIVLYPRLTLTNSDYEDAFGALLLLGGAVFSALAQVFVRRLIFTEATAAIVFWFSVTASCLGLLSLPWGWVLPNLEQGVLLVTSGLLGGLGQIFLTSSYRSADASLVAPFEYASMIFAILIGWFVFAEAPTGWFVFAEAPTTTMLIGASLIITAGILIIWRERQLGIVRDKPRKAMTFS